MIVPASSRLVLWRKMWRLAIAVFVLVCCSGCWGASRPASPPREASIVLAVEQVELANGLKLVVVEEPNALEVSVTVRYGVGSIDDPPGREGLAHLVEHLMFEHVRDGEALFDFLERSALGFDGFTTPDSTVYNAHAPPSGLKELLAVEQARLGQACGDISETSFVRQREIVRNELREREADDTVARALHAGVFSTEHPLGRPQATPRSVAALTREDACAFAAAHYAPSNAVVVVSGPVGLRDAQPVVEQTLGLVPRGQPMRGRVLAAPTGRRNVTFEAPTDRAWFVLSWPMPAAAAERARVRAVASMAATLVNARINGVVSLTELGTGAARTIAVAVAPSPDINFTDAVASAKRVISEMAPWFGSGLYEHAKNRALYALAASLDHGLDRDVRFADEAARGAAVRPAEEARALSSMNRDDARDLVRSMLRPENATLVTLRPSKHVTTVAGDITPVFREQRRRRAEDPRDAERPAAEVAARDPFTRARSRRLPNGLTVVLLPLSTMPTVDIRLVLPTGTGDEPTAQRGIALIAAHAIEPAFDGEMFRFAQSGGRVDADVGFDHTELAVRGLAANIDILLSGLATTVLEGGYTIDGVNDATTWQRLTSKIGRADRIANAVWREAVYGASHPYRHAGDWAHANRGVFEAKALDQFRRRHYVPGGATLIIAGGFDTTVAERWVEHAFKHWTGEPSPRRTEHATLRPLAFAQNQPGSQLAVQIAFAAPTTDEVALRVVVEMLEGAIADVREQIAASYGLRARLVQRRSSTTIDLRGSVDASRAGEALALLRDRLASLRERSDATASLFVSARRRVLARWASIDTSASAVAEMASSRAARGSPGAAHERARTLTIDKVQPLLEKLQLANAAILLRGPERALREAYAAIGRQPSVVE
jgi:zinc protease